MARRQSRYIRISRDFEASTKPERLKQKEKSWKWLDIAFLSVSCHPCAANSLQAHGLTVPVCSFPKQLLGRACSVTGLVLAFAYSSI